MIVAVGVGALVSACTERSRAGSDAAHSSTTTTSAAPPAPDALLPANARVALAKPAGEAASDRAILAAQDAVRLDMAKLDAWVVLGHAWMRKAARTNDGTSSTNADACASVVLAKDPDHAAAADLRGAVLSSRRELAEARQLAERITAKHPGDAKAWANLTDVLLELGRYEEAKDAARKLLELGPSLLGHSRTARIQWLHGDVTRAKASIGLAVDAASAAGAVGTVVADGDREGIASALVQSAMMSWHEGDYAAADATFDRALERIADFAPALAGKGRVAMARNEWTRAAGLFERAYEARPVLETARLLRDAREAAGDPDGVEAAHGLVMKNAPNDPGEYSVFLSTKKQSSKEDRGEALRLIADEHVKRFDVYTEDALAWALHRTGMNEPAKTAMGRARRLHTPDARILFHEGAIRIAGGDVKKGREVVAKALSSNPAFDWREAKEARELLR